MSEPLAGFDSMGANPKDIIEANYQLGYGNAIEAAAKVARSHGQTIGERCFNHENSAKGVSTCWDEIAAEIEKLVADVPKVNA